MNNIIVIEGNVSIETFVIGDAGLTSVISGESGIFYSGTSETHETYFGEYEVVPSTREDIILETADKIMTDDVTVKKVPYFETSNEKGKTVYIGEV